MSGASATAAGLIPAGARVIAVTTRVTTVLGTSNGTTGYDVGDDTDQDLFGADIATTLGTTSDLSDHTAVPGIATSANDIVLTAKGGNFDGTGDIRIVAWLEEPAAPTS